MNQDKARIKILSKHRSNDQGCWLNENTDVKRYSMMYVDGRQRYKHIVAYELFIGPVVDGQELHHTCENKACFNPWHLEPLTRKKHRATYQQRTHCPKGHPFTPENRYERPGRPGKTECYACIKERVRAWKKKKAMGFNFG